MSSRRLLLVALAGIAAWFVIAALTWAVAPPLGHDESQYAIAAVDLLAGRSPRWFYLSPGMNVVAVPGIWLGASEHALRLVPLAISGIGLAVSVWLVGLRSLAATGTRATAATCAAIALLVLAGARGVARYTTDLLSDFPAAACLLAAVAVIVDEVDRREGPRWRIVVAGPLFAAAFYVRYGSVVPIAVIVGAALLVGARTLARRPLPVIVTAAAFVLLLVPHFLEAHRTTGSPLGILLASRAVPQQAYFAAGLVEYFAANPFKLYGFAIPFALAAGLLSGFSVWRDRRRLLVWLIAVGALVAIGITTHAQVRYALLSISLLTLLGVDQIRLWLARLPAAASRIAAGVAIAAIVLVWVNSARKHLGAADFRERRMQGTLLATAAIRADAKGRPCTVIGYHYTQLEWYSGCSAPLVMDGAFVAAAQQRGERVYVVTDYLPTWTHAPQPVLSELPGTPQMILQRPLVVDVVWLDPP